MDEAIDLEEEIVGEIMNLEDRLRVQFGNTMASSKAAVFRDFDTYALSLPRRVVGATGTVLALYKLPFWADKKAVTTMALDFESNRRRLEGNRKFVRYATAPTASGKTASILPAFLDSSEGNRLIDGVNVSFSYYIYLAFDNNGDRNFTARGLIQGDYYQQGAFFMLKCLRMFFKNDVGEVNIKDQSKLPSLHMIKEEMEQELKSNASNGRCLIHIDEHRSMVHHASEGEAAQFRMGAIEALAEIPNVIIVATYTKLLTEIDPAGSSKVCRYPVAVPLLDIDAMAQSVTEFDMLLPARSLTGLEAGIVSSVRFRLAQKISDIGLLSLHRVVEVTRMDNLRSDFQAIVESEQDLRPRLQRLQTLLVFDLSSLKAPRSNNSAALLLCGLPEANWTDSSVDRQVPDIVLTSNGLVTTRLRTLLEMVDPSHPVYFTGATRFAQIIGSSTELLWATPLETAYAWVISTSASVNGIVCFGREMPFEISCLKLVGGRLFLNSMREDFTEQFDKLEINTMYFAQEGPDTGYKQDHPLCDLFFLTAKQQLVVIDVTYFNDEDFKNGNPDNSIVNKKRNRMITWIKLHRLQFNQRGVTLHGVVLAPFDAGKSEYTKYGDNTLQIQRGANAAVHLGGLSQLLFWYASDHPVEDEDEDEYEEGQRMQGGVTV
jgi:hypothetical protein